MQTSDKIEFIQRLLKMYFFTHLRTILHQIEFCFGKNRIDFFLHFLRFFRSLNLNWFVATTF